MDKYRVWHTEWEEFVTDYPICMNILTGKIVKFNYGEYSGEEDIEDTKYILSKSTGLKDKNGVEIFKGDIISCEIETIEKFTICEQCGCFGIRDEIDGFISLNSINETLSIRKEFEVIGNIYEHPHLLK